MDITLHEGDNEFNAQLVPIAANLCGVVTDAEGYPREGVKVTINSLSTLTDASGQYRFTGLAPGSYTIEFSEQGRASRVV